MMTMGIDPSIRECGLVVLEGDHLVLRRTLRPEPRLSDAERLLWLGEMIGVVAETLQVGAIGVEAQHVGAARGNALVKLAMSAGVVVGVGALLRIPVYLVQPSEARAGLGSGRMGKEQMARAIREMLHVGEGMTEHEVAAAAVALAASRRHRFAHAIESGRAKDREQEGDR